MLVEKYKAPEIVDQVVVLRVEGLIKLGESAEFFLAALQNVLLHEGGTVVIDLSKVDYIDSTGVGEFVGVTVAAVKAGANVVLAGATDRFHRLISIASPATAIEVFHTEDEALAHLAVRARPSLRSEVADLEERIAQRRIEHQYERENTTWTTWIAGVKSDATDAASPDAAGTSEPPRILTYSNDRTLAMGVTDFLEDQGFKAASVTDVEQLRTVLEKYGAIVDLIVEDLDSTGTSYRGIPSYFISANDELFQRFAARAPRLCISDGRYRARNPQLPFLQKPFPIKQLLQEVRRLLLQRGVIYRAALSREDLHAAAAAIIPVSDELLKFLARHPDALRTLGWRKFEEVVARLLEKSGFTAQVQAGSKDDGIDIIAVQHEAVLEGLVLLVQCKQVARNVGVRVVRELYGVTNQRDASMGVLVTTAAFTQPAYEFQRPVSARLSLRGYEKLKKWLERVTE
jgi:anti-anti-sigma factor